jgi:3-oxoacyl-[acyl-carrier-protein] synthase II
MSRAVITGLGAVSCLGTGVDSLWRGLNAGGGSPEPIADPSFAMPVRLMFQVPAAEIPAEPAEHGGVPLGSGPRMAVTAAYEALADAGVTDRAAVPVVLGVEMGNAMAHERARDTGTAGGSWSPLCLTASVVAGAIGSRVGAVSLGNACAASGYAVTVAADMIADGEADVVLVGGAEGRTRIGMGAFNRLGALDPDGCRPFDRNRAGTLFGDGAAMLVLESADHARARGVRPYAELSGAAWSCDAHHLTAPDPSGEPVTATIYDALDDAAAALDEVVAVVPHGTGTPLNDAVESRVLRAVFGDHCDRLPLLNLKAMIGHTTGAAGAFGCLVAALVVRAGVLPASPKIADQDPDCRVWVPQDQAVPLRPGAVLVNANAFGGTNVSLVVGAAR